MFVFTSLSCSHYFFPHVFPCSGLIVLYSSSHSYLQQVFNLSFTECEIRPHHPCTLCGEETEASLSALLSLCSTRFKWKRTSGRHKLVSISASPAPFPLKIYLPHSLLYCLSRFFTLPPLSPPSYFMPVTPLLHSIRVSSLLWPPVNLISLILDQCFSPCHFCERCGCYYIKSSRCQCAMCVEQNCLGAEQKIQSQFGLLLHPNLS